MIKMLFPKAIIENFKKRFLRQNPFKIINNLDRINRNSWITKKNKNKLIKYLFKISLIKINLVVFIIHNKEKNFKFSRKTRKLRNKKL